MFNIVDSEEGHIYPGRDSIDDITQFELGIYVSFTCDLRKSTWFHNPLYSTSTHKVKEGYMLVLRKIEYRHLGTFICHGIGKDNRMIIDESSIIVYG